MNFILFVLEIVFIFSEVQSYLSDDINKLNELFFYNLHTNIKGIESNELPHEILKNQVDNFLKVIKDTYFYDKEPRSKRNSDDKFENLWEKDNNVWIFDSISKKMKISNKPTKNIIIFNHDLKNWFATSLETDLERLVIYKFNEGNFSEIYGLPIMNGVNLGVYTNRNGTYIVVAENTTSKTEFKRKTGVFLLNKNEELIKLQNLDVNFATDAVIWEYEDNLFMAIKTINECILYKWLGAHFNTLQKINNTFPSKLLPFRRGKDNFLALANSNGGNISSHVDILKYDLNEGKFLVHQKLKTLSRNLDLEFFSFKTENKQENFLLVADLFVPDQKSYQDSVIYKFVDDYFVPFQILESRNAVDWTPSVGFNGEFILCYIGNDGFLHIYQHNGWKFEKVATTFQDNLRWEKEVSSLSSFKLQNQQVLVITGDGENMMYDINFKQEDSITLFYDEFLDWCKTTLFQAISVEPNTSVLKTIRDVSSEEIQIDNKVTFSNLTVVNLNTLQADTSESLVQTATSEIQNRLETSLSQFNELEPLIKPILFGHDVVVVPGNLIADNFYSQDDIFLDSFLSETLNDINVPDFLENIIFTGHNLELEEISIKNVKFEAEAEPKFINGHPSNSLLYKHLDLNLTDLQVTGDVIFQSITEIRGKINGYNISEHTLLLNSGNQTLTGNLNLENIIVQKVNTKFLNKLLLDVNDNSQESVLIRNIENLKVDTLVIGGFLNNIDLPTLDNYALRKFGDQNITSAYIFEELITNNINTNFLEDINFSDFVLINEGNYLISQDIQFVNNFTVKNLVVTDRLNQITVTNGKLDALLTSSNTPQNIRGFKTFVDLELLYPIDLKGKVVNLDNINPVVQNDEEIIIVKDLMIIENTTIEDELNCNDILTLNNAFGFKKLFEDGLSLNQEEIPVHLSFSQQINVNSMVVDNINSESPDDWIVNDEVELEEISGAKIIEGDLFISGVVQINKANDIDLLLLDQNTLKTDGDQVVLGKHIIKELIAERVSSDFLQIGSSNWEDLIKSSNKPQLINGTMVLKSLTSNKIVANNVYIGGKINDVNFNQIYNDTVKVFGRRKISGQKTFKNLTVNALTSRRSIDMYKIPNMIKKSEAVFAPDGNVELPDLSVDKIYFEGSINGISSSEFSSNWIEEGNVTIKQNQFFDKLVIFGKAGVYLNQINDIDLADISKNTVKIDEDYVFDKAIFDGDLISLDDIKLHGHIERVDLDNLVLYTEEEQVINDEIIFANDVFIRGKLTTFGLINDFNLSSLCEFAFPNSQETPKNLIIEGSAIFASSPSIKSVNGYNIDSLMNRAWLKNKETKINGNIDFEEVSFKEDVRVDGFVHGLKLGWLNSSYFSKTKNQTIAARLDFSEFIVFQNSLSAPKTTLNGKLFDINLEEFQRTALLDGIDQIFEETPFIENCNFLNLNGDFMVNGLNLQTDVMRYDVLNYVTGKKTFKNLSVENLNIEKHINVQSVDVLDWMLNSVTTSSDNRILGKTTFNSGATFNNGLSLKGKLNSKEFKQDDILRKSIPQEILAKINFENLNNQEISFKDVKLTGKVNNMDMAGFLQAQAFKTENSVFQTRVDFGSDIIANNVNFNYLYNSLNISALAPNLTNYINFNNYFNSYNTLLEINKDLEESLKVKASYIDSYKNLQVFSAAHELIPISNFDKETSLVALYSLNDTHVINILKWNEEENIYDFDSAMFELKLNKIITYLAPLEYEDESYLFLEYEEFNDGNGYILLDTVFIRKNESSYEILSSISMNGTQFVIPLKSSGDEKCLAVIYNYLQFVDIFCDFENKIYLKQRLEATRPINMKSLKIGDCFYLVVLDQELDSSVSSITVWKLDAISGFFIKHQNINTITAISITSITYKNVNYLAIASGLWREELYPGQVNIMRFNTDSLKFVHWQTIRINVPTQVEFAILPSDELVLYVLCENQLNPLVVFKYEGISKFSQAFELSIKAFAIKQFNGDNKHFLIGQSVGGFEIIQAKFKGN